ncbi:DUF3050 domain-containing protein [Lacihabitans sp. CCS-44]|uniref:DUF3050 domain-containing protein n=1 Tax=Lacihabitans sp. CCS-44 TaxID=2487331 RepID=UPI0020CF80C2|nr:DUF3050 domain-containing protein [Lacihabitans sp. CCS-44]MCP9753957.1 DUF3050 domain-containing protein [Lacihabitans sp. CCS-44]
MNTDLENLIRKTEDLRDDIINHKVFSVIETLDDLRIFMQFHVFAVWDFMSLLKTLQNSLTCTSVPWFPKDFGELVYFINEIVLCEESDIDSRGIRKSHYELYIDAMNECNADTTSIDMFLEVLGKTKDFNCAFSKSETPIEAKKFVEFTFEVIKIQKPHILAAVFAIGREDLIPKMFFSLVNELDLNFPQHLSLFKFYLERHIEIDGDHHSDLSLKMIKHLCGNCENLWIEAEVFSIESLKKRKELWDGAYNSIIKNKV